MSVSASAEQAAAIEASERTRGPLTRATLLGRWLRIADVLGLMCAFGVAVGVYGTSGRGADPRLGYELVVFVVSLPVWTVLASLHGLYRHDQWRIGHSTIDEFVGVVQLVTLGAWVFFIGCWTTGISDPRPEKLISFWLVAITAIGVFRAFTRHLAASSPAFVQHAVIVGAGNVGQLVARKLLHHREYGIELVGFVDDQPPARWADLRDVPFLGPTDELSRIIEETGADRVIVAFSKMRDEQLYDHLHTLSRGDVQVDIVPRLYELVGSGHEVHSVEGLPLLGFSSPQPSQLALSTKRLIDIVGSLALLFLLLPAFVAIALVVRRTSPGPMFFRQTRVGYKMREFTALKFRTMWLDTDESEHRAFIEQSMNPQGRLRENGLFKLERDAAVTPIGAWLRRTSLDELPQLINVLRGDMSLVGPRPCIPYETAFFETHHFERFLMPQGLTGFWQVTARAHSTFGEALDMDVAYVRAWSLWLDLRLLCRTPKALLQKGVTA